MTWLGRLETEGAGRRRYTTAGGDEGEQMRMMSTPLGMLPVLSRQESYMAMALTTGQYTSLGLLKSTSDWQVRACVRVAAGYRHLLTPNRKTKHMIPPTQK